jgi:hypothetical protein
VRGMGWMQGEADATVESWALAYEDNLTHFIGRVRDQYGTPDRPFSLGLIHCEGLCAYRAEVRAAQAAVATADPAVTAIETEDLERYPWDGWHYQGSGVRTIGTRLAQAVLDEPILGTPTPAVTLLGSGATPYYGDFTVGWAFELDRDVVVTDLGRYDRTQDGFSLGAEVALWDLDSHALLALSEVPATAAYDSELIAEFRYGGVEPLALSPGQYAVTVQTYASTPSDYALGVPIETAPGVTWLEGRHANGTAMTYPDQVSGGTTDAALWFGANLLFVEP